MFTSLTGPNSCTPSCLFPGTQLTSQALPSLETGFLPRLVLISPTRDLQKQDVISLFPPLLSFTCCLDFLSWPQMWWPHQWSPALLLVLVTLLCPVFSSLLPPHASTSFKPCFPLAPSPRSTSMLYLHAFKKKFPSNP